MKKKAIQGDPPTFVGLFSGCGGFDSGFVREGFSCLGAFDLDQAAVATHQKNIDGEAICLDVTQNYDELVCLTSLADVLVAGPPCQGFSTIGKRDLDDPRNSLLLFVADVATAARPKVVVIENVAGALAPPHNQYWIELENRLEAAGYSCQTIKCHATDFGLPQSRVRIILLARLTSDNSPIKLEKQPLVSLRTVLSGVDLLPNHEPTILQPGSEMFNIARNISPGQKLCNVRGGHRSVHTWDIPEVFGLTTNPERAVLETLMKLRRQMRVRPLGDADPISSETISEALGFPCKRLINNLVRKNYIRQVGSLYDLTNSFNGKYRRLSWVESAPTVDTRFGQPRHFLHPEHHRGLSVREAARLQGFADDFVFVGTTQAQFRMVGNAVPPPLAASVARFIRANGI